MALCDSELIERRDDVKLCVDFGATECIECLSDQGERVSILDCDVVQSTIVLADPYSPSWLRGEKEGCGAPSTRDADEPLIEVVIQPLPDNSELWERERAVLPVRWFPPWHQLTFVVPSASWRKLVVGEA